MEKQVTLKHPAKRGGVLRDPGATITTTEPDAAWLLRTGRAVEVAPVNRAIQSAGRPPASHLLASDLPTDGAANES